ncbi:MAG TPA: hypothetical protein V6C81_02425 [Planktothrix sp.]|jgi:hypothetical protein
MIKGTLVVNLNPPYIGFTSQQDGEQWKHCTVNDVKSLLVELDAIFPQVQWPPRDCMIRVQGDFPSQKLAKFGLTK